MAYTLTAHQRTRTGKDLAALRDEKKIPAILYGIGLKENQNVEIGAQEFEKVFREAGEGLVVELTVDKSKPVNVLIREVQISPVTRDVIHADFQAIDINKPVEVETHLTFVGEAPAVKASGGSLIKKLATLHVKCLPKDLVKEIIVPLEKLQTLDDVILVKDLEIPKSIEVLRDPEELIATVVPPRIEAEPVAVAEETPAEAEATAAAPEAEKAEEKKA